MNEKQMKVGATYETLKEGLRMFKDSEKWKTFLDFSRRFHNYSANNKMLIWIQRPEASRVAGFRSWQDMGRYVKAGEHGIRIFVPCIYKVKPEPTAEGEPVEDGEAKRVLRGFTLGYVFDVSQTEGKALPEAVERLGASAGGVELYNLALKASPVPTAEEDTAINGYYHVEEKRIVIKTDSPSEQKAKTMIHEMAHAVYHMDAEKAKEHDREEQELIAESVAYIVCREYGLDSSGYSFGYMASWNGEPDKMQKIAGRVHDIAGWIMGEMEKQAQAVGFVPTVEGVQA